MSISVIKIKTTRKAITTMLSSGRALSMNPKDKNLLNTNAKASFLGGGWWKIFCYSNSAETLVRNKLANTSCEI